MSSIQGSGGMEGSGRRRSRYVKLCSVDGRLWYLVGNVLRYYDCRERKSKTVCNISDLLNSPEMWDKLPHEVREKLLEIGAVPKIIAKLLEENRRLRQELEKKGKQETELRNVLYYVHLPSFHIKQKGSRAVDELRVEPAKIRQIDKALESIFTQLVRAYEENMCRKIRLDMYYDPTLEKICNKIVEIIGTPPSNLKQEPTICLPEVHSVFYIVAKTDLDFDKNSVTILRRFRVNILPITLPKLREYIDEIMTIESQSIHLAKLAHELVRELTKRGLLEPEKQIDIEKTIKQMLYNIIASCNKIREVLTALFIYLMGKVPIIDQVTHTKLELALKYCDIEQLSLILRGDYSYALWRKLKKEVGNVNKGSTSRVENNEERR